jgi:hypothetical protein
MLAAGLCVLLLAAQFATLLHCRHEFAQVESVVAMHSLMLAHGEGLYYDLQHYPYTVSPYGPVFYSLSAGLYRLGLPAPIGGRLLSFAAFAGIIALCWRLLRLHTTNQCAVWTGTLLIASFPLLVGWGTTGHVDVLALFFSLAAFYSFSLFRARGRAGYLVLAAVFLILAVFTKQTMIGAGIAILLLLALDNRRRAMVFALAAGVCGISLALALNQYTGGRYFDNAIRANLNPMSAHKALLQAEALLFYGGWLIVLAGAGSRRAFRGGIHPLYAYLGSAAAVLAVTAPKVGSDLNYQLEVMIALGLCAGWTLGQINFSPPRFRGRPTLLEIVPLVQIALSFAFCGQVAYDRWGRELLQREETAQLAPYLGRTHSRALAVQTDPLLQLRGRIEVEPLIYTLLVDSGLVNPEPVRRDLANGKFALVVLFEDVFDPHRAPLDREIPSLPKSHLKEMREHYRLVRHIPGPYLNGDYVYEPIGAAEAAHE